MKVGDLVIMPGSCYTDEKGIRVIGLIVDDNDHDSGRWHSRVAVLWLDGEGCVDWEPKEWLKVLK